MAEAPPTPPNHPTHRVSLSPGRINHIVSTLYPNHTANITPAQRGTSYNNRIYYLDISPSPTSTTDPTPVAPSSSSLQAVLKVSGHFFDHKKIQNEVASLLLLLRHCPEVPVPTVFAWSDDGRTISTYAGSVADTSYIDPISEVDGVARTKRRSQGWILFSRLAGRMLVNADLDGPSGSAILRQLAAYNHAWRSKIPHLPMFGNIRQRTPAETARSPDHPPATSAMDEVYTIGGFLLAYRYDPSPITTKLDYYTYHLKDQVHRVMTSRAYDDVRCYLVPIIADFIDRDLPRLSCVEDDDGQAKAVFSHMDFAPRNVLVDAEEGVALKVTGMVDWEFAAFLPEMDEYTQAEVRQEDDWEKRHWRRMMKEVGKLGGSSPPLADLGSILDPGPESAQVFDELEWKEICMLWRLIDNVAPWYVMEGSQTHEELAKELDRAGKVVKDCIKELQSLIKKGKERSRENERMRETRGDTVPLEEWDERLRRRQNNEDPTDGIS